MKVRMPGNFRFPIYIFGQYTLRELLRFGLPVLLAYWIAPPLHEEPIAVAILVTGCIVGLALNKLRPFGQPIESTVYHGIRWTITKIIK